MGRGTNYQQFPLKRSEHRFAGIDVQLKKNKRTVLVIGKMLGGGGWVGGSRIIEQVKIRMMITRDTHFPPKGSKTPFWHVLGGFSPSCVSSRVIMLRGDRVYIRCLEDLRPPVVNSGHSLIHELWGRELLENANKKQSECRQNFLDHIPFVIYANLHYFIIYFPHF